MCLFDNGEVSLRDIMRSDASTAQVYELIEATVKKKKFALGGHGDMCASLFRVWFWARLVLGAACRANGR